MCKTIIRIVRNQKSQLVINIPGDVARAMEIKGGDALVFEIIGDGYTVMSKVQPAAFKKYIGKKV